MELFCNYFADRIACRDFCNSHLYCRCVRDIDISVPVCVGGIEMNIIQYVQLREITLNSCRVGNSNIAVAVNITQLYAVEKRVVDVDLMPFAVKLACEESSLYTVPLKFSSNSIVVLSLGTSKVVTPAELKYLSYHVLPIRMCSLSVELFQLTSSSSATLAASVAIRPTIIVDISMLMVRMTARIEREWRLIFDFIFLFPPFLII